MPKISRYAVVESSKLGDDVVVGAFSYIGPDVRISDGCVIDQNVIITGRTTLGRDNHIFPNVSIGVAPDEGLPGRCKIAHANSIREHVVIQAGAGDEPTRLGSGCLIMVASTICASAAVGDHAVLANCTVVSQGACLEHYVRTSAFPLIAPGVTVGAYSFVGGYAVVDDDAPPFAMLEGNPFHVRGVNTHNLERCGFGEGDIRSLKQAYRELFDGNRRQASPAVADRLLGQKDLNPHVRRAIEAMATGNGGAGG